MADITLGNGKEIIFDLASLTLKEYRALYDPAQTKDEEDTIISRISGLTVDEYVNLSILDWKRLTAAFFRKIREPIIDPS